MQKSRKFHKQKQRSGVTTVEVAITFPIMMLLVLLVFEMSRIMMVQQCLEFAAQKGSRTASLSTTLTESQVENAVRNALLPVIPNSASSVAVQVTPATMAGVTSGTQVEVDVQVSLADVSWVPGTLLSFLGNPTLSAESMQDRQ